MTSTAPEQAVIRAVRSLTIAIWVLAVAIFVNALPSILVYETLRSSASSISGSSAVDLNNFDELPVEEKIRRASVIAITKYNKEDGKISAVITAIPKRQANVVFNYKIGDDYAKGTHYLRPNVSYGDGEVVFFTGSPATMRLSMTYSDDRIRGLGDIPMQKFLELVAKGD